MFRRQRLALEQKVALARVGLGGANDVERDVAQHRQVLWCVVLGHRAGTPVEADVQDQSSRFSSP